MKLYITLLLLISFTYCQGQRPTSTSNLSGMLFTPNAGHIVTELGKNIDCIFQDKDGNYWFGSNSDGIYRYDGKTISHYTTKDGLCSDFVWSIQQDTKGLLWFSTRDAICSFDGIAFRNRTKDIENASYGTLKYKNGGLFFNHKNAICFYDGNTFTNFNIHPASYKPSANNTYREYGVYRTLVDKMGNIWFGTQEKGVCVYDGKSFSYINDKDLGGPAVRAIFQDKAGILWFGNNGGGFYRYDGKTLTNITAQKNLGNEEFLKLRKPVNKPGSLARVFSINEDNDGNLWIGTADAGIWKYDRTNLKNYTTQDGLGDNPVNVIYKDNNGKLWFVSNGTVYHFNGQRFSKAVF